MIRAWKEKRNKGWNWRLKNISKIKQQNKTDCAKQFERELSRRSRNQVLEADENLHILKFCPYQSPQNTFQKDQIHRLLAIIIDSVRKGISKLEHSSASATSFMISYIWIIILSREKSSHKSWSDTELPCHS
jgi:hypothetical protein